MANCHRRVPRAPQTFTIARMYNTTLGQRLKRAVKTIKVRCVFALMVGLPGTAERADLRAEHNAQKLINGRYAACAHKRATITANP